jgi:hypothetical protein
MIWKRNAASIWRGLKFILIDWTVTPRLLTLNEQRPIIYQLITTPVVTLVFGLIAAAAIVGLSLLGVWPGG